jgi:thiamine-monophosphate kinase
LHQLGEFGLISRIRKKVASTRNGMPVAVGIGDDAFVAGLTKGHSLAVTKDLLIEHIHFKQTWATPYEIGYKSVAVNLSDLAAMGKCRPLYGFIGLGLPPDASLEFVDKLYTGMVAISRKYGLMLSGGDTVSTKKDIVISITLIGEVKKRYLLTRSCAQPGDRIMVTNTFGDSGAGLYLLFKGGSRAAGYRKYLIYKHLLPEPRLKEAAVLAGSRRLTAMIDSSDGLAASVRFLAEESRHGARIDLERIPLSRQIRRLAADDRTVDPVGLALTGGEDYELVFTVPARYAEEVCGLLPGITAVGEITSGKKVEYYRNGSPQNIDTKGFQHFAP